MTRTLRIGFSVAHATQVAGGISEAIKGVGHAVETRGVALRVFAGEDEHIRTGTDRWEGLDISVFPVRGPRSFGYQLGLRAAVEDWKPTSMHVHGLWMYPSWATKFWRRSGIPYVVAPHGMIDQWALSHSARKKRLALTVFERASLEHAACLHALAERELSSIRDFGLKNPVALIPNGVDIPRQTASGGTDRKVLLFLGRLHPKKGVVELLQAWKIIRDRNETQDWHLVIAGWAVNGYADELIKLRDLFGLTADVTFLGPVFGDKKSRTFAGADAFVLPSRSEGLPMAVLEAWSYGLPVLMTSECNLAAGFDAGAAVRVTNEPLHLADEIVGFFARPENERSMIGANGRALAITFYQWEAVADRLIALHHWIIGNTGKPDFVETA